MSRSQRAFPAVDGSHACQGPSVSHLYPIGLVLNEWMYFIKMIGAHDSDDVE